MRIKIFVAFFLTILLAACSGTHLKNTTSDTFEQQNNKKLQLKNYQTEGQIGYISKDKRFSSLFKLKVAGENFDILFFSTLVNRNLRIVKQQNLYSFYDQNGLINATTNPQPMLKNTIGFNLNLQELTLWLKGAAKENNLTQSKISTPLIKQDKLIKISYFLDKLNNINLEYDDFILIKGYNLPQNINVTNQDDRLKIKITKWSL